MNLNFYKAFNFETHKITIDFYQGYETLYLRIERDSRTVFELNTRKGDDLVHSMKILGTNFAHSINECGHHKKFNDFYRGFLLTRFNLQILIAEALM